MIVLCNRSKHSFTTLVELCKEEKTDCFLIEETNVTITNNLWMSLKLENS